MRLTEHAMEWSKPARTADLGNGILTLDGEKQFEVPELTAEVMDRLAARRIVTRTTASTTFTARWSGQEKWK